MAEGGVLGVALAGLDLEAGFDHIAWGCEVCGWHACDCTGCEELEDTY